MRVSADVANLSGREVFSRVLGEAIKNVIFFGVGAIVVFVVGKLIWMLGVVLFGVFVLVMLVSVIQFVLTAGLGLFMLPVNIARKMQGADVDMSEEGYLQAAAGIQAIEMAILLTYTYFLWRSLF